jgi:hypothetical protein
MLRRYKLLSATAATLLSGTLCIPAALAGPPPPAYYAGHGDAHRYYGYPSASGHCNGDDVGTVLGAVAGGVIGANAAQGDAQAAGALFGAVLGGVIGHQIGRAGDPDCHRVGVPAQGYYPPPVYYRAPRPVYVVPSPPPVYIVPAPRRVYAVPYRQPGYHAERRHDDHRGNQDRHRDDHRGHDGGDSHRDGR